MNTLHVIKEIVTTREPMAWNSTLAVTEVAKVRTSTVTMHTVGLTLMAEKAGSR